MPTYHGRCHCGNLELSFETELQAHGLSIRACSCSFCSRHGARTTSDPSGSVRIVIHDSGRLSRYRFGFKTADFLICKECGVYVGAVFQTGGRAYATVNANVFMDREGLPAALPVSYEGENESERRARREARWTPATVIEGTVAGAHPRLGGKDETL